MIFDDLKVLGFESFIIFNGAGSRINADDILYKGFEINPIVEEILYALSTKTELKYITMVNNIVKIQKMIEMANPSDIVMTKFFHKIRSTHKQASGLGEKFVSLNIFLGVYPNQDYKFLLESPKSKIDIDDDRKN